MAADTTFVGTSTGSARVVVERSAISNFASAVTDQRPIHHDAEAAADAGFTSVPATPTFAFVMENWGTFAELQTAADGPSNVSAALAPIIGPLMAGGGLVLHGEQAFEYHRTVQAGDVLVKDGRIADIYEKETSSALMTFIVVEEIWRNDTTGDPVVTSRMNLIHRGPARS